MTTNTQIVDLIERANDAEPFCSCGRHTTPVAHDGAIWLECSSLGDRPEGRVRRLIAALAAPTHTRTRIVDVPTLALEPTIA